MHWSSRKVGLLAIGLWAGGCHGHFIGYGRSTMSFWRRWDIRFADLAQFLLWRSPSLPSDGRANAPGEHSTLVRTRGIVIQTNGQMVSNIFHFHPYLGKITILTNIFQRGWNHQLEIVSLGFVYCDFLLSTILGAIYLTNIWGPFFMVTFQGSGFLGTVMFYGFYHGIHHHQTTTILEKIFGSLTFHPHRIASGKSKEMLMGYDLDSDCLCTSVFCWTGKCWEKVLGWWAPYLFFSPPQKSPLFGRGDIPNK